MNGKRREQRGEEGMEDMWDARLGLLRGNLGLQPMTQCTAPSPAGCKGGASPGGVVQGGMEQGAGETLCPPGGVKAAGGAVQCCGMMELGLAMGCWVCRDSVELRK